jgi:hypothetical protein
VAEHGTVRQRERRTGGENRLPRIRMTRLRIADALRLCPELLRERMIETGTAGVRESAGFQQRSEEYSEEPHCPFSRPLL